MTKAELDHKYYLAKKDTPEYKKKHVERSRLHKQRYPAQTAEYERKRQSRREHEIKTEVLMHYGLMGRLQCSWAECEVTDIDMLSLDHIHNDGAQDRNSSQRGGGGKVTYHRVRKEGFPDGFQTLCHNHQWKKELMRRRGEQL